MISLDNQEKYLKEFEDKKATMNTLPVSFSPCAHGIKNKKRYE